MRARWRVGLVRVGAIVVLLAAVAPNVLYVGHWGSAGEDQHVDHPAEVQEHAEHCHIGPAKCSGQASFTGTWSIGGEAPAISFDSEPRPVVAAAPAFLPDFPAARLDQPPRGVA